MLRGTFLAGTAAALAGGAQKFREASGGPAGSQSGSLAYVRDGTLWIKQQVANLGQRNVHVLPVHRRSPQDPSRRTSLANARLPPRRSTRMGKDPKSICAMGFRTVRRVARHAGYVPCIPRSRLARPEQQARIHIESQNVTGMMSVATAAIAA